MSLQTLGDSEPKGGILPFLHTPRLCLAIYGTQKGLRNRNFNNTPAEKAQGSTIPKGLSYFTDQKTEDPKGRDLPGVPQQTRSEVELKQTDSKKGLS